MSGWPDDSEDRLLAIVVICIAVVLVTLIVACAVNPIMWEE